MKIHRVISDKTWSPTLFILGFGLLLLRLRSYMEFQTNYFFEPETSHISYLISFLSCFALISSLRQPVLNAVPFMLLPSFFITIPFWDFAILSNASNLPPWEVINALTIHMPSCALGIWVLINRKELVSMQAIGCTFFFGITYFIFVDNKDNTVGINGMHYMLLVAAVAVVWIIFMKVKLLKTTNMTDPFLAKLVILQWKK